MKKIIKDKNGFIALAVFFNYLSNSMVYFGYH